MSKAICPNPDCRAVLGCTCKLRTGPDGKKGCTKCIVSANNEPKKQRVLSRFRSRFLRTRHSP